MAPGSRAEHGDRGGDPCDEGQDMSGQSDDQIHGLASLSLA